MANHGFRNHALCLSGMMMRKGSRLSFLNQSLISFWYPFLFWLRVQFDQRTSIDVPDPSPLDCRFMSISWNREVLLCRRFVSGVLSRRRWFVRLSTGDVSLTRGYGGFTRIFDPGIKVLAEDEDVVQLVLNGFTPSNFMAKKKIRQVQWFPSCDSVSLSVFGEEDKFVSDPLGLNRNTNRFISEWPYQFSYTRLGFLSLLVNISNYGRYRFNKQRKNRKESTMIAATYVFFDCGNYNDKLLVSNREETEVNIFSSTNGVYTYCFYDGLLVVSIWLLLFCVVEFTCGFGTLLAPRFRWFCSDWAIGKCLSDFEMATS